MSTKDEPQMATLGGDRTGRFRGERRLTRHSEPAKGNDLQRMKILPAAQRNARSAQDGVRRRQARRDLIANLAAELAEWNTWIRRAEDDVLMAIQELRTRYDETAGRGTPQRKRMSAPAFCASGGGRQ